MELTASGCDAGCQRLLSGDRPSSGHLHLKDLPGLQPGRNSDLDELACRKLDLHHLARRGTWGHCDLHHLTDERCVIPADDGARRAAWGENERTKLHPE